VQLLACTVYQVGCNGVYGVLSEGHDQAVSNDTFSRQRRHLLGEVVTVASGGDLLHRLQRGMNVLAEKHDF
jgi:hypothetical protein